MKQLFETLGALDGIVLCVCLIGLVVVSLIFEKKASTAEKIGSAKSFSVALIVGATVATYMGAATGVGNMALYLEGGFAGLTVMLMWNVGWIFLCCMAGKLRDSGANTLPEFIAIRYGRRTQKISSAIALVYTVSTIAGQFMACGTVFYMLGLGEIKTGILIFGSIIILLTLFGGLKGVATTNTIQSIFIVTVCVLIIPVIAFIKAGGIGNVFGYWSVTAPEKLNFFTGLSPSLLIGYMLSYALACGAEPSYAGKFLAAKDTKTGVVGSVISMIICTIIPIPMCLAAMSTPLIMPDITLGSVFYPEMISRFLPVVIKGLAMFSFVSLFLTTGDSFLQLASILITNDYVKPLMPSANEKKLVFINKACIIGLGVFAILTGLWGDTIIQVMALGSGCYGAGVFFPLLLGCFAKRKFVEKNVNIAMVVGCAVTLLWNTVLPKSWSVIPGVVVGAILCLIIIPIGSKKELSLKTVHN